MDDFSSAYNNIIDPLKIRVINIVKDTASCSNEHMILNLLYYREIPSLLTNGKQFRETNHSAIGIALSENPIKLHHDISKDHQPTIHCAYFLEVWPGGVYCASPFPLL
jgi:hypothetical protein